MNLKEKISKEKDRIKKIKNFFEEKSFKGSQFWKWVQEFGEMEQELKNYIKVKNKKNLQKLIDEIADEIITRYQTEIKEEDLLKKLELEKWKEVYLKVLKQNEKEIINRIDFKLNRTEQRIKDKYYEQYNY